jgi:hypothetical protein
MATPDERAFATFPRGHARDNVCLAHFRAELRVMTNPDTGITFTEDEIQRLTGPGTRFYIEADAIDLLCMAQQQRAAFLASQIDPRRANTNMLESFHGRLWLGPGSKLPATGAGGPVRATGTDGAIVPGSLTVPDPVAAVATDPNGQRFQVLESAAIRNGEATITLVAVDGGVATRLPEGTELKWSVNVPPGLDPTVTALATFDGGFDQETDAEYERRIEDRIRNRPASGNAAHFQAWAQEASSGVEQAFTYPCALNAGSVVVAITEKRANVEGLPPEGPHARVASGITLNAVAAYLATPASPVVPERAFVLVTGVQPQPSDLVLRLSVIAGRSGGWADVVPWPAYSSSFPAPAVATVDGSGLVVTLTTDRALPNGAATLTGTDAPKLMLFNREISRWVRLSVQSIVDPSPGSAIARAFTITLASAPEMFDASGDERGALVGDRLSPYTDRADALAESIEAYFDSLGPGEVVEKFDPRYARAARQPRPAQQSPMRAGQSLLGYVVQALGGSAADAELTSISRTDPDVPTSATAGPNMVVLGQVSVSPL